MDDDFLSENLNYEETTVAEGIINVNCKTNGVDQDDGADQSHVSWVAQIAFRNVAWCLFVSDCLSFCVFLICWSFFYLCIPASVFVFLFVIPSDFVSHSGFPKLEYVAPPLSEHPCTMLSRSCRGCGKKRGHHLMNWGNFQMTVRVLDKCNPFPVLR